jgi:hypothetical protein
MATKSKSQSQFNEDFDTAHLSGDELKVANIVKKVLASGTDYRRKISGGGCKAFRRTCDHIELGEEYGHGAVLILVHDGGDLAPWINYNYGQYDWCNELSEALEKEGYLLEQCTCWYACVTKL